MTQPLNPAAQAVKDAVLALYSDEKVHRFGWQLDAPTAAAALRALADQVVPHESEPPCGEDWPWPPAYQQMSDAKWEQRQQARSEILAIAAELEGGR